MNYIYLIDYVHGEIYELDKVASKIEFIDDETCVTDIVSKLGLHEDEYYWMSTNKRLYVQPITIYDDLLEKLYPNDKDAEIFLRYLRVQLMGNYNMITDKMKVMEITKLSMDQYDYIQQHYEELDKRYPKLREVIDKEIMEALKY